MALTVSADTKLLAVTRRSQDARGLRIRRTIASISSGVVNVGFLFWQRDARGQGCSSNTNEDPSLTVRLSFFPGPRLDSCKESCLWGNLPNGRNFTQSYKTLQGGVPLSFKSWLPGNVTSTPENRAWVRDTEVRTEYPSACDPPVTQGGLYDRAAARRQVTERRSFSSDGTRRLNCLKPIPPCTHAQKMASRPVR